MSTILPPPSPTIAVLSQKGGTGKTTTVRTLADVFRRVGLDVLAVDLDPQGNLSDYFDVDPDAYPTIGEVLAGHAEAADAIHKNMIPANLGLAEAELVLSGKMGRELTLQARAARVAQAVRPGPDRLPAGARPADRERARRLDARARERGGRVLLAPGRRAGARGDAARAREPERGPRLARRRAEHRRPAHEPLARRARVAARELRRPRVPDRHPQVDPLPGVGRARRCRSSTTGRSSVPTTSSLADECSRGSATRRRASASARCAASSCPAGPREKNS